MFTLGTPWILTLIPLPFLLWSVASRVNKKTNASKKKSTAHHILHPQTELLETLQNKTTQTHTLPWFWLLGCMLILFALTKPQWIDTNNPGSYQGHQMVLAVDTSGSMQALDFIRHAEQGETLTDRLTGVKETVRSFINKRHGDQMGLIVFADDVFIQSPISSDLKLLQDLSSDIKQGIAGEKTALGDAIAVAVQLLKNTALESRLLILFTDGSNTTGNISPENAIRLAQHHKVRIYTIGVGSAAEKNADKGILFPQGPVAKPVYAQLPLNQELLQRIANATNGAYYRANDSKTLTDIIQTIDKLEPIKLKTHQNIYSNELFWLPLLVGLFLLLLHEWTSRSSRSISYIVAEMENHKTTPS